MGRKVFFGGGGGFFLMAVHSSYATWAGGLGFRRNGGEAWEGEGRDWTRQLASER